MPLLKTTPPPSNSFVGCYKIKKFFYLFLIIYLDYVGEPKKGNKGAHPKKLFLTVERQELGWGSISSLKSGTIKARGVGGAVK